MPGGDIRAGDPGQQFGFPRLGCLLLSFATSSAKAVVDEGIERKGLTDQIRLGEGAGSPSSP